MQESKDTHDEAHTCEDLACLLRRELEIRIGIYNLSTDWRGGE